jgi:hypothetical protein
MWGRSMIYGMACHDEWAASCARIRALLTGSAFGVGVYGPYQTEHRDGAGQLMIALDVAKFPPLGDFEVRVDRHIAELTSAQLAQGFAEIIFPGDLEVLKKLAHEIGATLNSTPVIAGGSLQVGQTTWRQAAIGFPNTEPSHVERAQEDQRQHRCRRED